MKKHEGYRFYLATAISLSFILLPIGGAGGSTDIRQNHKSMLPSINASIGATPPKPVNRSPLQNNAGLTPHFRNWLAVNGYSGYNFARDDVPGGSYGGKQNDSDVYTIWSTVDEVIGYGCVVYGRYTTQIPGQNGEQRFNSLPYGHINSKDLTGYYQLRMVKYHVVS